MHLFKLTILLVLFVAYPAFSEPVEVLFIGNSFTAFFDMPGTFTRLAEEGGQEAYVDRAVGGGLTLASQVNNPITQAKIAERAWEHVVLQEQSRYPVIEYYREGSFYPSARSLDASIRASNSETTFFMTWGYEEGGQHCIGEHCSPDYPDYFAMQLDLEIAYSQINAELDATLVPIGLVWTATVLTDPTSPLWHTDGYHPSPDGAYLNACIFYAAFFGESPEGIEYYGDLDPTRAQFYQSMAGRILTAVPGAAGDGLDAAWLLPNHPNPFNPLTTIGFELRDAADVKLEIFTPSGRLVGVPFAGPRAQGRHQVTWDAGDAPGGIYLCRLSAGGAVDTRKLTLIR